MVVIRILDIRRFLLHQPRLPRHQCRHRHRRHRRHRHRHHITQITISRRIVVTDSWKLPHGPKNVPLPSSVGFRDTSKNIVQCSATT